MFLPSGALEKIRRIFGIWEKKGGDYDNAMMESFYKTLKRELINDAHFETRAEATQEIFKYIETYYNTKRMHSGLDYKSPKDFEKYNS